MVIVEAPTEASRNETASQEVRHVRTAFVTTSLGATPVPGEDAMFPMSLCKEPGHPKQAKLTADLVQ